MLWMIKQCKSTSSPVYTSLSVYHVGKLVVEFGYDTVDDVFVDFKFILTNRKNEKVILLFEELKVILKCNFSMNRHVCLGHLTVKMFTIKGNHLVYVETNRGFYLKKSILITADDFNELLLVSEKLTQSQLQRFNFKESLAPASLLH